MIRASLLVGLLLVNAGLLAAQLGWLPVGNGERDPGRLARQIHPERLRVLPPGVSVALATPAIASAVPLPAPPVATPLAPTPPTPASPAQTAPSAGAPSQASAPAAPGVLADCVEIGPLSAAEATQAKGLILATMPAGQGDLQSVPSVARWWIHLPDVGSHAEADQLAARLRQAGVTEYYVLGSQDKTGFAISLGLFNEKARAERLADALRKKGFAPLVTAKAANGSQLSYRVTNLSKTTATSLIAMVHQQWPATAVQQCAAQ
ncbi:SPOR domain-containing protein [Pandoraea sp.]|uniref:SPOR domain-containing protein n=1 Tax=Pandoraea sp. TaxID=1883445 RepID=UPI001227B677|nr:SPOR domain-containing protein [Pandoraea sp.]TAL52515.1 MAG: SPOR domain-containing protein [Pandoraea sp.]TAM14449.1 MAG: SPOR domain-containing protein [Pandoraea sp.]